MTELNFIPGLFTKIRSFTPFPEEHFCSLQPEPIADLSLQNSTFGCAVITSLTQPPKVLRVSAFVLHRFCCSNLSIIFAGQETTHTILQALGRLTANPEHSTSPAASACARRAGAAGRARFGGAVPAHRWVPHTPPALPALPSPSFPRHSPPVSHRSVPSSVRRAGAGCQGSQEGISTKPALS